MTATNHAMTGALIGMYVQNPLLAVVLAVMSHFALDSLPHFGASLETQKKLLIRVWTVDFVLLWVGLAYLIMLDLPSKPILALCAIAAMSPDVVWVYRYMWLGRHGRKVAPSKHFVNKFHTVIQWSQTPRGIIVELFWSVCMIMLLLNNLGT